MKNIYLIIISATFSLIIFTNCKESGTKEKTTISSSLPSISFEEMQAMHETCDYIDFIFYNVDFSMSVNNKTNIQKVVGFVSTEIATPIPSCKAMGRVFFQKNGELMAEADMFLDKQCQYFIFQKDGKPIYANKINQQGQLYFQKVFSQVKVEPIKE